MTTTPTHRKVARFDISVGKGLIGVFDIIPAGQPIPDKYSEYLEQWEKRGLLGDAAAKFEDGVIRSKMPEKEVTQEEVDAELKAIHQRAIAQAKDWSKAQQERFKLIESQGQSAPADETAVMVSSKAPVKNDESQKTDDAPKNDGGKKVASPNSDQEQSK